MAESRFKQLYEQHEINVQIVTKILVDTYTGVNYLWYCEGTRSGLTVLLDKDGKPVVTPIEK